MTDRDDPVHDADLFDGLDLDAALLGVGTPSAGWEATVASGRRRRHRRTASAAALCALLVVAVGVAIAARGTESSTVYTNDGTVAPVKGEVVYYIGPESSRPDSLMSVYTTGVYDSRFRLPDGSGWQFMSYGVDSDPHVAEWSFETYATTLWSIESERFGTIRMSCRQMPGVDGLPEELPRTSLISMFQINGIYYSLSGGPQLGMPATCDSAQTLDPSFLAVLDQLRGVDLQSWMVWAGVDEVREPLPDPPSTDLPR